MGRTPNSLDPYVYADIKVEVGYISGLKYCMYSFKIDRLVFLYKIIIFPDRRIFLSIIATYGRSLYALVIGLFCVRWTLMALGEVDLPCGMALGKPDSLECIFLA